MKKFLKVTFVDHSSASGMSLKELKALPLHKITVIGKLIEEDEKFLWVQCVGENVEDEIWNSNPKTFFYKIIKSAIVEQTELVEKK